MGNKKGPFHVGRDGSFRYCEARPGHCPLGGTVMSHYTLEEAQSAADAVNKAMVEGVDFDKDFVLAKNNRRGYPRGQSETAVNRIRTIDTYRDMMKRMSNQIRDNVKEQMDAQNITKIRTEDGYLISLRSKEKGNMKRTEVDSDKVKAAGEFEEYSKDMYVKEFLSTENKDHVVSTESYRSMKEFTPTVESFEMKFTDGDKPGEVKADAETSKMIRKLVEFENISQELKATKDSLSNKLMDAMKAKNISYIPYKGRRVRYNPPKVVKIVDVSKLKADNKREMYLKDTPTIVKRSISIKKPKTA